MGIRQAKNYEYNTKVEIVKATLDVVEDIYRLIYDYSQLNLLLYRTREDIMDNISSFYVARVEEQVVGCVSKVSYGPDLIEIRSLAVKEEYKGMGIGKLLVLEILRNLRGEKVFALTYSPDFFKKLGFKVISKDSLPQKIWRDCDKCPLKDNCKEIAMGFGF